MSATAVYCPTCGKPNWPGRDTCEFCWAPFAPAAVPPGKPLPTLPVPLLVVLHYLTLGIFPLIWLNLYHGHLPRRRPDDPSAGAAVGRLFIPFYHLYWLFFTHARLADRLEEERDRYGLPRENLYDLLIACGIAALTPCLNIAALLLLFPIAAGLLQHQFNELARAQAQAQPAEPVASLRCPGCGQESPAAAIYCYHCGSVLAAAAPQSPEFYGTGGELLGRVLLAGLSMLPLVSAGYGFAYAWSWLVDRLCLPRGIRLSYQQNGRAIWLPAAGYALLTLGPAVLAMQVAGRHDLDFLSVLLPLGLVPITAGLLLVLLRRLLGATRMPDGGPARLPGRVRLPAGLAAAAWPGEQPAQRLHHNGWAYGPATADGRAGSAFAGLPAAICRGAAGRFALGGQRNQRAGVGPGVRRPLAPGILAAAGRQPYPARTGGLRLGDELVPALAGAHHPGDPGQGGGAPRRVKGKGD